MSNKAARAKALKEIFDAVKKAPKKYGFPLDNNLRHDFGDALFAVGKEKIYELKDEIFPFLKEENPYFREKAIRVLSYDNGDGLNLPEMKDIAYDFWLNDPADSVRVAALDEWGKCYAFSKDPIVLKYLYNILYSDEYSSDARRCALLNFMIVAEDITNLDVHDAYSLGRIKDNKLFVESMNNRFSDKISNIMKKYVSKAV